MSTSRFLKQQEMQHQQQYFDSDDANKKPEREAFMLTRIYEALNEDGFFSIEDKKILEKVDALLEEANIQINADARYALTSDNKGNSFAQKGAPGGILGGLFDSENLTSENQADILDAVYAGYTGDDHKFTKEEQSILQQVDTLLSDANIMINSQTGDATISWKTDTGVRSQTRNFPQDGRKGGHEGKSRKN